MIDCTIDDNVATVTIDRPEVLNALDQASHEALETIWQRLERMPQLRAVVLTGRGERAFCVGADMKGAGVSGLDYWMSPRANGFGNLALRTTLDVPVIGRVNGHALGGGLEMMLGCDIVVAADHATFGLPEPRVGRLPLDGGMVLLQRQIGYRAAMGMMLTGRRIKAPQALDLGLVNEIVPAAGLDAAVGRWVDDIRACAPLSLRAIKQTVRATARMAPEEANAVAGTGIIACMTSQDGEEGVRAFLERRPPQWKGC
ncbi:enoyl-CoA hydratase/isomerase family protein [Gluconacetobacter azotocaptans]|uniref:enoyl-CoA hydratase-related protein n=1 Tax=Gluconacetobacter azotocaptans TaxID=142834 RepID=UPI001958EA4D|nr:enoyl-CoA hydratase-related protein [Gluconacetobacter azotocaptans]MBM9400000.1 enoyl-CoA hydratase/isomerase family protein [Gluconacetobacter azotocaptans]